MHKMSIGFCSVQHQAALYIVCHTAIKCFPFFTSQKCWYLSNTGGLLKSPLLFSAKILFTSPCSKTCPLLSRCWFSILHPPLSSSSIGHLRALVLRVALLATLRPSFRHSFRKQRSKFQLASVTMHFTFMILAAVLIVNLLCTAPAAGLRSYQRHRDLETVKPISELGWTVPLLSGKSFRKLALKMLCQADCTVRHTCASFSSSEIAKGTF